MQTDNNTKFKFPTAPTIQNIPVQPHRPIANAHPAPEVTQSTRRVASRINLELVSITTRGHFPHHTSPALKITSAPQIVKEQPIVFNEPARSVPKIQISHEKVVQQAEPKFDEQEFRRQAESAKYKFASEIDDEINGNLHQREEVRDGLAVKGKYSYSDGYYKRTVHYEADDKGYRVVK